uniref:Nitric-oxide reductase protein n=1 Tax=uncultured bacterium F25-01 TaxID=1191433 RepID=I3VIH2_9BACT|nr:nitric-oxide reductase protein [uncultured bacterium F25-01]
MVNVVDDAFVVAGRRFVRRAFPDQGSLHRVNRRGDPASWGSQLAGLTSPGDLQHDVPTAQESFSYLSPTMARSLARIADIDQSTAHRGFILLIGPTGCGKTTLAKTYCHLANQPCTELSFSGDTSLSDFYTSVELVRDEEAQSSTLTVPGPAIEAMRLGKKLLLNEINMLPPDLLTVFSQAVDTGRLVLSGTERGNVEIEVHREFGLIGTANPNYVGTLEMGRAIERRFGRGLGYIEMDFLPADEEAVAIENEFARERVFAAHDLKVSATICRRIADLASRLRSDPQIGNVMQSRLSTRSLVHWLGLAQITSLPLVQVLDRALLTTVPADARDVVYAQASEALGDTRLDVSASAQLHYLRVTWPALAEGVAVPIDVAAPTRQVARRHRRQSGGPVIHRIRFVRALPDGGKAIVAEPMCQIGDTRYGIGLKIRGYDRNGRQIADPDRLADIGRLLRDEDGLNVARPLGHLLSRRDLLPCLTAHTVRVLEIAEAAQLLGRPIFIAGPTGAGKSSLARTLAFLRGQPVVEVGFNGETAKTDLSAVRRLIGGVTRWQTQAFLEALADGDTVIANEYNLAYPDVHSLLNGLFDKGASYALPDGRVLRMHDEARVIATGYLEGPGVKPLNEGVENRYGAVVGLEYPPVADEVAVLRFVAPTGDADSILRCVRLVDYCRRLVAGKVDAASLIGLSRAAQEALRQAAKRAALSTAELVALARVSGSSDFAERLRIGILEGAPESVRRVLEPVLLQYGLG